jgi:hypothetical protein
MPKALKDQENKKDGEPLDLRNWSVMPARFVSDKRLSPNDVKILAALGLYTNQAGVCWPTQKTIERFTGIGKQGIMDGLKRLERHGYIRVLKGEYWPGQKSKWLTNRYQVLWRGNEPLPKYEDLKDAHQYNLGEDKSHDAETIPSPTDKPQATYTDRVLKGVAAAWNRELSKYGSFADESLAIQDAPAFLQSIGNQDINAALQLGIQSYRSHRKAIPSRITQIMGYIGSQS